jgi:hypothetical protein
MKNMKLLSKILTISLTILIIMAIGGIAIAQDTIYTYRGKVIPAKVYEVTQNDIRFKRSDDMGGKIHILTKDKVSLVTYKNGSHETFLDEKEETIVVNKNTTTNNNQQNYSDDTYNQGQQQQSYQQPQQNYQQPYNNSNFNLMLGMPYAAWGLPYFNYGYGYPYRYYGGYGYYNRGWYGGYGHGYYGGYRGNYGYGGGGFHRGHHR